MEMMAGEADRGFDPVFDGINYSGARVQVSEMMAGEDDRIFQLEKRGFDLDKLKEALDDRERAVNKRAKDAEESMELLEREKVRDANGRNAKISKGRRNFRGTPKFCAKRLQHFFLLRTHTSPLPRAQTFALPLPLMEISCSVPGVFRRQGREPFG